MDPTAFLAFWLAISTAFSTGAEHLKQKEYAPAVAAFNQVITAESEADGLGRQARLLRGHALCALDQRDMGLLDLMSLSQYGDDTTKAEARRLLTKYGFTERQRTLAYEVVNAFAAAASAGDQAGALAWCKGDGVADLQALWDQPKFVQGMNQLTSRPLPYLNAHHFSPYGCSTDIRGVTGLNLMLAFDGGWWISGITDSTKDAEGTARSMLAFPAALVEHARAHDGDFPPALTPEYLPAFSEDQLQFYNGGTPKYLPYTYLPPPRRLSPEERRSYMIIAAPKPKDDLQAVGYADGHVRLCHAEELERRLAAQALAFPPATAPATPTDRQE